MSRVFFTADTHFGHENVLKHCARPFSNIKEHDEYLVDAWNSVVNKNDIVWHLGDFAFRADETCVRRTFGKLNGQKFLVTGNHDKQFVKDLPWSRVYQIGDIGVDGTRVVMCHYAMRTWPGIRNDTVMLYGHSHGNLPGNSRSLDVGVDCWNYMPIDIHQIRARLAELPELRLRDDSDEVDINDDWTPPTP